MPGSILEDLITLFVVLDPIGSIPIFLNATEELGSRDRPRVALVAVFVALLVLMLFLYCGQYALEAMHISIPAFRIAGCCCTISAASRWIRLSSRICASGTRRPRRNSLPRAPHAASISGSAIG